MFVVFNKKSENVLLTKGEWGEIEYKWIPHTFWQIYTHTTPWELLTCESLYILAHDLINEAANGEFTEELVSFDDSVEIKIEKMKDIQLIGLDEDGVLDFLECHELGPELYDAVNL